VSDKEKAKARTAVLKRLREEHSETVKRTQAALKEQNAIRKQIREALADGPLTVPEVAAAIKLPSTDVLWHMMAMKKYDLLEELGMEGEYYQYQLAQEKSK